VFFISCLDWLFHLRRFTDFYQIFLKFTAVNYKNSVPFTDIYGSVVRIDFLLILSFGLKNCKATDFSYQPGV